MKLLKIVLAIILMTSLAIGLVAGCADNSETTTTTEQTSGEQIDSKQTDETNNSDLADDPLSYDYSVALDDNGYWKDVRALDYVTLFDYENIKISEEIHGVSLVFRKV